jgi:hypothetical protein
MMKPWLVYSLIRFGLFAGAFAVLLVTGVQWLLAAVLAATIAFCVSYIFFRGQRDAMTSEMAHQRQSPSKDEDAEAEDALS